MASQVKIAPSILSADFGRLCDEVQAVEAAGADWIHADVMDGRFVPQLTIGPLVVEWVRRCTELPLDCHLMVDDPDPLIAQFQHAGAASVSVHVETCHHLHRTIDAIRRAEMSPGVVLNPATPLNTLEEILPDVDFVLIMSVNPGWGGQHFIPAVFAKLAELRRRIQERNLNITIQVDGGVNLKTIRQAVQSGATNLVAGSAVFTGKSGVDASRETVVDEYQKNLEALLAEATADQFV